MKHFFLIAVAFISFKQLFSQYTVNGNSTRDNCHCYTLTPDAVTQSGSVWNNLKNNRFGQVVFSTRDYHIGWDGYFKGTRWRFTDFL